jgi:phosphoribosylamine--glycine ligase
MKVLLVGGGGREHALAWRIARSPRLKRLVASHPNPGWPDAVEVIAAKTNGEIVALAYSIGADLVVVGPEAPLTEGLADQLGDAGIPCFGPTQAAARLEGSKAFTKAILDECGLYTAGCVLVDRRDPASVEAGRARCREGRVVVKADGLAAGKGVVVCVEPEQALIALDEMIAGRFGGAADRILLEDLLEGPEISLFGLSDGVRVAPLLPCQDHKRLLDGDLGPNTGGMGAYGPCPLVDPETADRWVQELCGPVVEAMARRGSPFRGVLFAGLMLTERGPAVLEFNVRFGDPETQALMTLWDDDILPWLYGAAVGQLPPGKPRFREGSACCVVVAAAGYPEAPVRGTVVPEGPVSDSVTVFQAGTARDEEGRLVTAGGRVLGVTGYGPDLAAARDAAYAVALGWRFPGAQLRTDIGARGLLG